MNTPDLTPDQLAYIRAAAARYRMDGAGPQMLEALRKCEAAIVSAINIFIVAYDGAEPSILTTALESARAAIAAAE